MGKMDFTAEKYKLFSQFENSGDTNKMAPYWQINYFFHSTDRGPHRRLLIVFLLTEP